MDAQCIPEDHHTVGLQGDILTFNPGRDMMTFVDLTGSSLLSTEADIKTTKISDSLDALSMAPALGSTQDTRHGHQN